MANILDRMAIDEPRYGQYNFYADTRWKGPVTPAHRYMNYDPQSLYGWRGPQVTPMHYNPQSLDDWKSHRLDHIINPFNKRQSRLPEFKPSQGGKTRRHRNKKGNKGKNSRRSRKH